MKYFPVPGEPPLLGNLKMSLAYQCNQDNRHISREDSMMLHHHGDNLYTHLAAETSRPLTHPE